MEARAVQFSEGKEKYVHELFSSIARRYDMMNTVLSFGLDKYWRRVAARLALPSGTGRALDVCCGTGMLTLEMASSTDGQVVGVDFCEEMLAVARQRARKRGARNVEFIWGDALNLPFEDSSFDCATIAFALRNVTDIKACLGEMARVVRPGGRVVSLDLARPSGRFFSHLYFLYFERIIPLLGRLGVRKKGPYEYLVYSLRVFPHQLEILEIFREAGLRSPRVYELTGGIVAVHMGTV